MALWSKKAGSDAHARPESPVDSAGTNAFDQAFTDEPAARSAEPKKPSKAKASRSAGRMDPVNEMLSLVILGVVILALATVVYALVTNLFGNGAPRSASEQRLIATKAKVEAGSKEAADWDAYILALIENGQYSAAQSAIEQGKATVKNLDVGADMSYMQAELDLAQGDLDGAMTAADEALTTIKASYETGLVNAEQSGNPSPASAAGFVDNYWYVLLVKAEVLEKQEKWSEAVEVYDEYLAGKPTMATVYTQRGDAKEKLGDTAGAEADYRQTLAFMPDDPAALAGLDRIGAAR